MFKHSIGEYVGNRERSGAMIGIFKRDIFRGFGANLFTF
jgi:hypothetical protein